MSNGGGATALAVWRMVRTPLTLIALLAVLAFGAMWGYERVTAPIPPRPPEPCVEQAIRDGRLQSSQVTVRIFNGGGERGLAGDVAARLRDRGFEVSRVANTEEAIGPTVIVGQAPENPEVKLVLAYFPGATVRPDPNRTDRAVEVLVGAEFGEVNATAPQTIAVEGTTVCLPAVSSAGAGG